MASPGTKIAIQVELKLTRMDFSDHQTKDQGAFAGTPCSVFVD
jgi:hypothetical protein